MSLSSSKKYLKYKTKYTNLRNMVGGVSSEINDILYKLEQQISTIQDELHSQLIKEEASVKQKTDACLEQLKEAMERIRTLESVSTLRVTENPLLSSRRDVTLVKSSPIVTVASRGQPSESSRGVSSTQPSGMSQRGPLSTVEQSSRGDDDTVRGRSMDPSSRGADDSLKRQSVQTSSSLFESVASTPLQSTSIFDTVPRSSAPPSAPIVATLRAVDMPSTTSEPSYVSLSAPSASTFESSYGLTPVQSWFPSQSTTLDMQRTQDTYSSQSSSTLPSGQSWSQLSSSAFAPSSDPGMYMQQPSAASASTSGQYEYMPPSSASATPSGQSWSQPSSSAFATSSDPGMYMQQPSTASSSFSGQYGFVPPSSASASTSRQYGFAPPSSASASTSGQSWAQPPTSTVREFRPPSSSSSY